MSYAHREKYNLRLDYMAKYWSYRHPASSVKNYA